VNTQKKILFFGFSQVNDVNKVNKVNNEFLIFEVNNSP